MKRVLFLLVVFAALFTGCKTQEPAVAAADAAREQVVYEKAINAIDENDFVLEADRIDFRRGRFTYVTPNTNFIMVDGKKATIQLAFNSRYAGPNGIGGITLDGNVTNVSKQTTKRGQINYQMNVQGAAGSAVIRLSMFEGSNKCSATISSNFSANQISFSGYIYPKEEASIFKGRSF